MSLPSRLRSGGTLSALILLGAALLAGGCQRRPPDSLLLIIIDTLRADHLGAWGYPHPTSPRLDTLAHEGVRAASFFSTSPWTRPGVASLLTGLYPRSTGIYEERFDALAPELDTLAERLQRDGYLTIGVNANPNLDAWFGFDQGFDLYADTNVRWPWMPETENRRPFAPGSVDLEGATSVTDRALAALDRERAARPGRPFYLQLLYVDPHRPYTPPAADHQRLVDAGSRHPGYDGEIHHVDREIGRLLDDLAARRLLDSTLVVVTSDHGEGLDDHPSVAGSHAHGNILYDSVLHVPFIVRHPRLPAGRVIDELASSIDLLPTVLELLDLEPSSGPGRSLAPVLRGDPAAPPGREWVWSETDWKATRKLSVRSVDLRFIRNDDSLLYQREGTFEGRELRDDERRQLAEVPPEELYETASGRPQDPATGNLRNQRNDDAVALAAELVRFERRYLPRAPLRRDPETDVLTTPQGIVPRRPGGGDPATTAVDPELLARLRALGYLDGGGP